MLPQTVANVFPVFTLRLARPSAAWITTTPRPFCRLNYFLRHKSVLIKIASGRSRKMEHEPDFITALGQQRDEFVCSLWTFIAYLAMSFPNLFVTLSALRRSTPFRHCGGYSRWGQQLDGCRGTRAALRRVEHPGQGGVESRPLFGGSGSRPRIG